MSFKKSSLKVYMLKNSQIERKRDFSGESLPQKKSSDQLPNTQVLPPFPKLPHFDLRHRFGLQDDIKEEVGKKLACLQEELSLVPFSSH